MHRRMLIGFNGKPSVCVLSDTIMSICWWWRRVLVLFVTLPSIHTLVVTILLLYKESDPSAVQQAPGTSPTLHPQLRECLRACALACQRPHPLSNCKHACSNKNWHSNFPSFMCMHVCTYERAALSPGTLLLVLPPPGSLSLPRGALAIYSGKKAETIKAGPVYQSQSERLRSSSFQLRCSKTEIRGSPRRTPAPSAHQRAISGGWEWKHSGGVKEGGRGVWACAQAWTFHFCSCACHMLARGSRPPRGLMRRGAHCRHGS